MPKFKFTSTQIVEAENRGEAKEKFANTSFDFAANAECKKIKPYRYEIIGIMSTKIESELDTELEVIETIKRKLLERMPNTTEFEHPLLVKKLS